MAWELWRQDEHGNEFIVGSFDDQLSAERERDDLTGRGHHQHYWVKEILSPPAAGSTSPVRLVVSPSLDEQRQDRGRYELLAADIAAVGFEVELEPVPDNAPWDEHTLVDVALVLGSSITGAVAQQLMATVMNRLGRRGRRDGDYNPGYRTAVIYGPDGEEVLAEFRIPERDD